MVLSEDLIFQLEIPSEVKGKAVASAYLGMNVWDISLMGHIVDDLKKHMNSLRSWCLNRCRGECLGELSVNVAAKGSIKNGGFPPFSCRIFHYKPSSHCRKPSIWVLIYSHIAYSFQSWEESPPTKLRRRVATSWGPDSHPSDGFCPMTSNDYTRRCPR